jgi:pheromone shutdown protein TraB
MLGRFGHISLATVALVAIVPGVARPAPQTPTEIVVVGTVHTATEKYSVQDLVRILQRVRPDVILFEYPADMMTPGFESMVATSSTSARITSSASGSAIRN